MSTQAGFTLRGRNPDVLTCIANLSNDEVFTPPEFANRMLDTLAEAWAADHNGADLWADKTVKFLDPFTKSGIFLREIASRLTKGLGNDIPDLGERVNHILTKQVFGRAGGRLSLAQLQHGEGIIEIGQDRHPAQTWNNLAQDFDPLAGKLVRLDRHASDIATGPGQARDNAVGHGVPHPRKNNRDD
jgi:hypothetical protein